MHIFPRIVLFCASDPARPLRLYLQPEKTFTNPLHFQQDVDMPRPTPWFRFPRLGCQPAAAITGGRRFVNRRLWGSRLTLTSLIAIAATIVLALPAEAQVKPFKITGGGIATEGLPLTPGIPGPHWAVGEATELGRYYGEGAFTLLNFTGPTTANFSSAIDFVMVGANKDKLVFTYGDTTNGAVEPGEVVLSYVGEGKFVAVFTAEFNPVIAKCTGRFAKVSGGSFIMVATSDPFVLGAHDPVGYTWEGAGELEFKTGN